MGNDIVRHDGPQGGDIIDRIPELKRKRLKINLSEKISQVKGLLVTIERMKTVEMKSIELKIDVLHREIDDLYKQLGETPPGKIVDAEIINSNEEV